MTLVCDTQTQESSEQSHSEPMHAERRRGVRVRQLRPVKIFDPAANRYIAGQTQDISSTGLRLELGTSPHILPGHVVSIHVGLSDSGCNLANRRSMIPARIIWVERTTQGRRMQLNLGVEFIASIAAHLHAA